MVFSRKKPALSGFWALALDRTKLDTDGKLDSPFSHGYTDFCPNLPPLTDTSEWPQFSFAAGVVPHRVKGNTRAPGDHSGW